MKTKFFFLIAIFSIVIIAQQKTKSISNFKLLFESKELLREVSFKFKIKLPLRGKGQSLILLSKSTNIKNISLESLAEPNIKGTFAIGFDTENLPPKNPKQQNMWFGKGDNIYNQPQREVSIHYNNVEYANRFSKVEFRDHVQNSANVRLHIRFVHGGAFITLLLENLYSKQVLYNKYFVPHMKPYLFQVFFTDSKLISDFQLTRRKSANEKYGNDFFIIAGFQKKFIRWANNETNKKDTTIQFPKTNNHFLKKVIFELEIHGNKKERLDGWDRLCSFFVHDKKNKKIEIARFITPYSLTGKWFLDVTDYYPLLKGKKVLSTNLQNWFKQKGFLISSKFYFYLGKDEENCLPQKVISLGNDHLKIGNPKTPVAILTNQKITIGKKFNHVKLKMFITGHGYMEFTPINYFIKVENSIHHKKLWNEDCYLNPYRPQSGTWKFSRSGWCPGATVYPIEINITDDVKNGEVNISHITEKYIHQSSDKKYEGEHFISRAVIVY